MFSSPAAAYLPKINCPGWRVTVRLPTTCWCSLWLALSSTQTQTLSNLGLSNTADCFSCRCSLTHPFTPSPPLCLLGRKCRLALPRAPAVRAHTPYLYTAWHTPYTVPSWSVIACPHTR